MEGSRAKSHVRFFGGVFASLVALLTWLLLASPFPCPIDPTDEKTKFSNARARHAARALHGAASLLFYFLKRPLKSDPLLFK